MKVAKLQYFLMFALEIEVSMRFELLNKLERYINETLKGK